MQQKIRIRLKAFDHHMLDQSAQKIVETAKRTGALCSWAHPAAHGKECLYHPAQSSREQGLP